MSWDGTCPWGYNAGYTDMVPTCTYNGGLADTPYTPAEWADITGFGVGIPVSSYTHGKGAAAAMGQGLAPVTARINESMNVSAGGMDWTTILIYGGIAVLAITLLSKGRR